jgi:phage terminase small subunit
MTRRRKKDARIGLPAPPLPLTPPRTLKGKRARELWRELAAFVANEGTHTIRDAPLLEKYCRVVAELEACGRFVKELGIERSVELRVFPIDLRLGREMLRLASRLGFTPVDRRRSLLRGRKPDGDS